MILNKSYQPGVWMTSLEPTRSLTRTIPQAIPPPQIILAYVTVGFISAVLVLWSKATQAVKVALCVIGHVCSVVVLFGFNGQPRQ